MKHLVPLEVRIGIREGAGKYRHKHAYPPFNEITKPLRDNMDWSHFIDQFGGWHYDQLAGHDVNDVENRSPAGMWLGMFLVPKDFASEAVARWPSQCRILQEVEAELFYNNRAHFPDPEIREDHEIINGITSRRRLQGKLEKIPLVGGDADDNQDRNAIDPDHPQFGRRRNNRKTWEGFKIDCGIIIDTSVARVSPQ